MRVKISDGVREVEIEMATEDTNCLREVEAAVQRMYSVVAPTGTDGKRAVGFSGNGWSTLSDHERDPEVE